MKFTKFTEHKPVDNRDPGFALPGYQLRWLSSGVHERRPERVWSPITLAMLPDELLKRLKAKHPFWFRDSQGDTIRRRGDVLAFAPIEEAAEVRKENRQKAQDNMSIFNNRKVSKAILEQGRGDMQVESSMHKISLGKDDFE
jgi:hypothetical protein